MLPIPFLSAGSALPALPGTTPVAAPGAIDFAALLPAGIPTLMPRQGDAEPGKQLPAIAAEQDDPAGGAAVAWIVPPIWDMMRAPVVAAPNEAMPAEPRPAVSRSAGTLAFPATGQATSAGISSGATAAPPHPASHPSVAVGASPAAIDAAPAVPPRSRESRGLVAANALTTAALDQQRQVTASESPIADVVPPASIHAGEGGHPLAPAPLPDSRLPRRGSERTAAAAAPLPGTPPRAPVANDHPSQAALTPTLVTGIHPGEDTGAVAIEQMPVPIPDPGTEPPHAALTTATAPIIHPDDSRSPVAADPTLAPGPDLGTQPLRAALTPVLTAATNFDEGPSPVAARPTVAAGPGQGEAPSLIRYKAASSTSILTGEGQLPVAPAPVPVPGLARGMESSPVTLTTAIAAAISHGRSPGTPATNLDPGTELSPAAARAAAPSGAIHTSEGVASVSPAPLSEPASRQVGVEGDIAPAGAGQPEASPRTASTKDQPAPIVGQPAAAPQQPAVPLQPARIAPAAQVFAAAIHQAARDERRPDAPDSMIAAIAPATTDLAAHAVTAVEGTRHPALDMARDTWPAKMIERIEMIRDAMDAVDTSIRLIPDKLGAIDVSLKQDGDTVQVHIVAQQPETRQLLADAQPKLAELAEAKGLKLSAQLGDGGGQQQQQRAPNAPQQTTTTRPGRAASNDDAAALADERIA
ncbi:flagellar hook-length control protein FliK [Sphingomonas jeddahensis]|uniref:Flagellar hook-length control protein FliK n=1 Tax=Sphingomonas jeddahensis TaxID=1915074 RepID=A0A1V2EVU0_9SPHN|nr:flagellar hook-length control protein FliK [Sphingomonas jeddahensis]ONF96792.1 Flagellar hook-length control protein FliK [Sphingomonas jeddahensis]